MDLFTDRSLRLSFFSHSHPNPVLNHSTLYFALSTPSTYYPLPTPYTHTHITHIRCPFIVTFIPDYILSYYHTLCICPFHFLTQSNMLYSAVLSFFPALALTCVSLLLSPPLEYKCILLSMDHLLADAERTTELLIKLSWSVAADLPARSAIDAILMSVSWPPL